MSLESFAKNAVAVVKDNSPSILAALAVGGIATSTYVAYNTGYYVGRDIGEWEYENGEPLSAKKKVETYWKQHIPVFLLAGTTIACVIAGTAINNRRNAILGGTLALSETAFREYRDKVEKVVSKQKREQVDQELAQDKMDKASYDGIIVNGEDILMMEMISGRVFVSTTAKVEKAEIEIGRRMLNEDYVSVNEWYDELGLARTELGDTMGWNHENPLEVAFVAVKSGEKPAMGITYRFRPTVSFNSLR